MPAFKVNLGEKTAFEPLEAGRYLFKVAEFRADTVKAGPNAGATMYRVRFDGVEGTDSEKKSVFNQYPQVPGAEWSFERFLNACGIETPEDPEDRENFELNTEDIVGKEVVLTLEVDDTYDPNAPRNTVVREDPPEVLEVVS